MCEMVFNFGCHMWLSHDIVYAMNWSGVHVYSLHIEMLHLEIRQSTNVTFSIEIYSLEEIW